MSTLFIEPFSGMAGDMFLAALLGLRDERFGIAELRALADELVPGEARIEEETVQRGSLSGTLLTVTTPESESAPHRHLSDLSAMVERSSLSPSARERAQRIFRRIAEAEARVHGTSVEEIHFHEVGAVDAVVDVCGAALALERLEIDRVLSTPPVTGQGTVRCAHGEMPVPAPGTAEILCGLPVRLEGGPGERLTPTGAAILAEIVDVFESPVEFQAQAVGYGAGHREFEQGPPNLLRVTIGREPSLARRSAWLLEFNIDDMTGEEIGFCVQEMRAAGALEVWTAPVQMKKDRPGVILSALCRAELRGDLERLAFEHTTTLGVRWAHFERAEAGRESLQVEVEGCPVSVKVRLRPGEKPGERDISPEFDDLARLARQLGITLRAAEELAREEASHVLGSS